MKKKILVIILLVLIIAVLLGIIFTKNNNNYQNNSQLEVSNYNYIPYSNEITVVPTMFDTITTNSSYCATFELIWSDMKEELVGQDIVFEPQEEMVINLNKGFFTKKMLSDKYYYNKIGVKSLKLKEEIETEIKNKFNQTSNVLDSFDWYGSSADQDNINTYIFYTMLYKEFQFLKEFQQFDPSTFGDDYEDIKYFGAEEDSSRKIRRQIKVLYYNTYDDFAIILKTKSNDELIFVESPIGNTFKDIYENMNTKASVYKGKTKFTKYDYFMAPELNIDITREYNELENKLFNTKDGNAKIEKAIQTINFDLDSKGGKIKSEAAMGVTYYGEDEVVEEGRYFEVDDTFVIFLREKGKELPYFAARVEDITKFQNQELVFDDNF